MREKDTLPPSKTASVRPAAEPAAENTNAQTQPIPLVRVRAAERRRRREVAAGGFFARVLEILAEQDPREEEQAG